MAEIESDDMLHHDMLHHIATTLAIGTSVSSAVSDPNHHSDSPGKIKPACDCISSLPDVILQHILSYIPTKLAIRTSVLSKRWKHVWCEIPSLFIDYCRVTHPFSIEKTLSSYSAPKITSFSLLICPYLTAFHVNSWIKLAMSREAENFYITIIVKAKYNFPDFFFVNSSVKQLSLSFVVYDEIPRCTVSWTSLRSLSLTYCKLSNKSIANILSGCPMLESLTLSFCKKLNHLNLSKSVRLTKLDIHFWEDWALPGAMQIVAPHIHYLRFTNFYIPFNLVDVSSLTEANLILHYFDEDGSDFRQDMVLKILAKLQKIKKLTIGPIFLQILSLAELRGVPFPQLKIEALVVKTMIVRSVIPGITRLLKNSPGLKKITIVHTMRCNAISDEKLDIYLNAKGLNPNQCWNWLFPTMEQTSSLSCIAKEVKLIHVASFMKLVLKNAKALETVVLHLRGCLNTTDYQTLLIVVAIDSSCIIKNVRDYGQPKAILKSVKIIP